MVQIIKLIIACAACAFLVGCVREPSRFASTTDETLYDLCLTASDRWYDATGIVVDCLYGRSDMHTPMRWGDPGGCAAGSTDSAKILVRAEPKAECNERVPWPDPEATHEAVVVHEMGHLIAGGGNGHAYDGVMSRVSWAGAPIDESTLDWLCSAVECAWREAE